MKRKSKGWWMIEAAVARPLIAILDARAGRAVGDPLTDAGNAIQMMEQATRIGSREMFENEWLKEANAEHCMRLMGYMALEDS